jgi:hypothetical protein
MRRERMVSTFLDFQKATDRYEEGVNAALDSIDLGTTTSSTRLVS